MARDANTKHVHNSYCRTLSGISVVVGSIEFTNPLSCVRFLKSAVGSPTITCGGKYGGALSFRTGFVSYSIEYRILERKTDAGG